MKQQKWYVSIKGGLEAEEEKQAEEEDQARAMGAEDDQSTSCACIKIPIKSIILYN